MSTSKTIDREDRASLQGVFLARTGREPQEMERRSRRRAHLSYEGAAHAVVVRSAKASNGILMMMARWKTPMISYSQRRMAMSKPGRALSRNGLGSFNSLFWFR